VTTFDDFTQPSSALLADIKRCGTVIIRDVVSEEQAGVSRISVDYTDHQALKWLEEIEAYIKLNPEVKGFPADDKQVFEL